MRKLTLDSLTVESFDTAPIAPRQRGTVDAHQVRTWNAQQCGETKHFDCTPACSWDTSCPTVCFGETENTCPSALDDC